MLIYPKAPFLVPGEARLIYVDSWRLAHFHPNGKLPGIPPFNFWKPSPDKPAMTRAQRDEFREGFNIAPSWVIPAFPSFTAVDNLMSGLFLTAGCCRLIKKGTI
jgi:hypothetical protein